MHKRITEYTVALVHYTAGFLAFGCLDDRFYKPFDTLVEVLKKQGGHDHVDRIVFAGGAHDLAVADSAEQESLFGQIEKSIKLHHTHSLVAVTHEDCGVFGEEAKCDGDREKQFSVHLAKHQEIEAAILRRFPQFNGNIRHFYLSINGAIEINLTQKELNTGFILP